MRFIVVAVLLGFLQVGCLGSQPSHPEYKSSSADAIPEGYSLTWEEKFAMDAYEGTNGIEAMEGISLADIVRSSVVVRSDGLLCSDCHNRQEQAGGYSIEVAPGAESPGLDPWELVARRSWAEEDGWSERFLTNGTKPEAVKFMIRAYLLSLDRPLPVEVYDDEVEGIERNRNGDEQPEKLINEGTRKTPRVEDDHDDKNQRKKRRPRPRRR
ncbi:MAG: hypothetical protein HRU19_26810 [Pseudobacteriovorax sp.]|nr:hypothetical protein [Pseudobacteriovorax sp.]